MKDNQCNACQAYRDEGVAMFCPEHRPKPEVDESDYWAEREEAESNSRIETMYSQTLDRIGGGY